MHPLVAAFAVLALVVTAGMAGAARGQAKAVGEIVICSGQGAVTLAIDADGNPAGPAHWCPDCVLTLLAAVSDPVASLVAPAHFSAAGRGQAFALRAACAPSHAQARGPPVV